MAETSSATVQTGRKGRATTGWWPPFLYPTYVPTGSVSSHPSRAHGKCRKIPCWHPSSVAGRPHPGTLGSFEPYKSSTVLTASSMVPPAQATCTTALAALLSLFLFKGDGVVGPRHITPTIRERRCSPSYDPLEQTDVEITGTTVLVMRPYLLSLRAIVSHTVAGTEP